MRCRWPSTLYLIWILGSKLIRSNNQSSATLWVLETCLSVWTSSLYNHLDHCFVVFKNIQQSFLMRKSDVWGNKVNIIQNITGLARDARHCKQRVSSFYHGSESRCQELKTIRSHKSWARIPSNFLETQLRTVKNGETRWWTNVKLVLHLTRFTNVSNLR